MKKLISLISLILILVLVGCSSNNSSVLRIGVSSIGSNFHPYYYTLESEEVVVDLVHERLFSTGVDGIIIFDGNIDEVADLKSNMNFSIASLNETSSTDSEYKYVISIREDVRTPDGTEIGYKDVLFDIYYLLDPSYKGPIILNTLPIKGLEAYIDGVKEALKLSKTKSQAALDLLKVEGISLKGETIEIITTRKLTNEELNILNIHIIPLDYYGKSSMFNLKNNRFGFQKGAVEQASSLKGIGKYQLASVMTFDSYDLYLKRNNAYYKGKLKVEIIKLTILREKVYDDDGYRIQGGDAFYLIDNNEIDIAYVDIDDYLRDEVPRYNMNLELNGDVISVLELEDETKGFVYSTKRIDKETLEKMNLNNGFDFINKIDQFSLK